MGLSDRFLPYTLKWKGEQNGKEKKSHEKEKSRKEKTCKKEKTQKRCVDVGRYQAAQKALREQSHGYDSCWARPADGCREKEGLEDGTSQVEEVYEVSGQDINYGAGSAGKAETAEYNCSFLQ